MPCRFSPLFLFCGMFATQQFADEISKAAKDYQRDVRQCEYPACEVKAKDTALHKCPRCRVTLYCGKDQRLTAPARPLELLPRADSALRLPRVQEAGADQVRAVQGRDVLRREAHVEALVGARERVRGAARAAQVDSWAKCAEKSD